MTESGRRKPGASSTFGIDSRLWLPTNTRRSDSPPSSKTTSTALTWCVGWKGYEAVEPGRLDGLPGPGASPGELRVEQMRFGGGARSPGRSVIVVNPYVALSGIPDEAHRYEVNGRSALEWLVDRYRVRVDKDSRIVNDPNCWSDDPCYVVELVARVVRVAVESAEIMSSLPPLGI